MSKHGPAQREDPSIRILVAMDDGYRAYREVIAAGLEILRPGLEVVTAGTTALEGEDLDHLNPQMVVCHHSAPEGVDGRIAWVELPLNPTCPMEVSLRGRPHPATSGPTLGALLAVVDEAERLPRPKRASPV